MSDSVMSESLRVVMLIQGYYPQVGGAERQLASLAPRLRDLNTEIRIVTRRSGEIEPFANINNIPVYRLSVFGPKAIRSLAYTLRAILLIKRLQPDIVHSHGLLSPTTTAVLAKNIFRIPLVIKCMRGGLLGDVNTLKRRVFGKRRLYSICRSVDRFICISNEINSELSQLGIESQRRCLIPNGVDIERFKSISERQRIDFRSKLGFGDELIAVFTGRFALEKQLDQLIRIWPGVRQEISDATLLLIGKGNGEYESKLRHMAGEKIHFIGSVDDVLPYLQIADLFVLPSVSEGLSNSLLEAMSVGVPSIATKVGGTTDLITQGNTGWLVQPERPEELKAAIVSAFKQKNMRAVIGGNASKLIVNSYSLDSVSTRIRDVYRDIMSTNPHSVV